MSPLHLRTQPLEVFTRMLLCRASDTSLTPQVPLASILVAVSTGCSYNFPDQILAVKLCSEQVNLFPRRVGWLWCHAAHEDGKFR